jgi:hypothetical protein
MRVSSPAFCIRADFDEVFGLSLGTESDDHARRRLSAAFDEFTNVDTASMRQDAGLAPDHIRL